VAAAGCEPQARDLGLRLVVEADEPAPAIGDHDRVVQIARNLMENALRCSPENGRVRVLAGPGVLRVLDEGPGLTEQEARHAFERFYLYRRFRGERPVGTGLGLAIVKELAEAMGGRVDVSSERGAGARFDVHLPLPGEEGADAAMARQRRREVHA